MLPTLLFLLSIVFFFIAGAIAVPEPWRDRLICFGLTCFAAAEFTSKMAGLMHQL